MVHPGPRAIAATKKTPERLFEHDEFIRDDTTAELLAALPAQPGTTQMTAANSTPLTDGASAIVLTSGQRAAELGIEPIARVVSSAVYGIDPLVMGLAPAWAIPLAISRAGLTPEQIDVWEVHEASVRRHWRAGAQSRRKFFAGRIQRDGMTRQPEQMLSLGPSSLQRVGDRLEDPARKAAPGGCSSRR
ncbi:MAG: hypothetical protein QOE52_5482 [Mycobacterium sp.]|jgi:hypothetical protein|nr:hypothetical protein [Mycobacterium sp.]